ncbi:MAG: CrcB family protein [Gaiellales bacterium]
MATPAARGSSPAAPYIAVALGAIVGGYLRVGLALLPYTGSAASWPWVTFSVNVAGTLVLAFTAAYLTSDHPWTPLVRPLVGTGFCGALTTFSTLQLEVFRMLRAGHVPLAIGYLAASIAAGVIAFVAGAALARGRRP